MDGLFAFIILAFGAGLAALLTPCVFPMIPLTVSYFGKDDDGNYTLESAKKRNQKKGVRNALLYGFFIILIYVVAGTIVAKVNGPEFANWLSTHWIPNVMFFLVFFVFALSFLGLFEITLPNSWVNKMDKKSQSKGILGVFFMAFTLVLISFSCTGPIVGSVLVLSAGGEIIKPIIGMLAFSLALALPFTLFAAFPQWLQKLPKSGGWLQDVKVVLGFLELALAFKFLSIADQVYHWGILDRDIFLALWIVIFTLLGLFLIGKLRLPYTAQKETSIPKLLLAIVTFVFVVYMVPGMVGAPLKPLSGYLPPLTSQEFALNSFQGGAQDAVALGAEEDNNCTKPKYNELFKLPHGLQGYFDLEQAKACAEIQNKPIFIDFTGHGCVNCRAMEARVWSDPNVLKILKEDYVVVALYVDDKTELPEDEWYVSVYDNKIKKSIGKQNADYQITKFRNNAQPFYVLMTSREEVLAPPKAYDLDVENFIIFLKEGINKYKSLNK
ncbi:MAG: protein-disulfide reductase DsbD family protein [Allomuricauda sp.]